MHKNMEKKWCTCITYGHQLPEWQVQSLDGRRRLPRDVVVALFADNIDFLSCSAAGLVKESRQRVLQPLHLLERLLLSLHRLHVSAPAPVSANRVSLITSISRSGKYIITLVSRLGQYTNTLVSRLGQNTSNLVSRLGSILAPSLAD